MLQSFLIIKDSAGRDSVSPPPSHTPSAASSGSPRLRTMPEAKLSDCGFRTTVARKETDAKLFLPTVDGVVLAMAAERLSAWSIRIRSWRDCALFWWWEDSLPELIGSFDFTLDGFLCPSMSDPQLLWAIEHGHAHYRIRTEWQQERHELMARMEERKTIERAKTILCQIKRLSEAEAYDFLRKQAMNDRKRMIDVAQSIVNVYELLHQDTQGGRAK